jgi:hypothetical protein
VTAREELRALLDSLSEEEAAACVKAVSERRAPVAPSTVSHRHRPSRPGKSPTAVSEFLRKWSEDGPTMTEEQWDELTKDLDAHRPHRPLFN